MYNNYFGTLNKNILTFLTQECLRFCPNKTCHFQYELQALNLLMKEIEIISNLTKLWPRKWFSCCPLGKILSVKSWCINFHMKMRFTLTHVHSNENQTHFHIMKVVHQDSSWNRGKRQLVNDKWSASISIGGQRLQRSSTVQAGRCVLWNDVSSYSV